MTFNGTRKPSQIVAIVLVVGLILGSIGAAGLLILTGGDDEEAPPQVDSSPTLQLSRTSTGGSELAAASAGAGYQLAGTLDQSTGEGVVIDPSGSRVAEAKVRTLLTALGMTSVTLTKATGGWTATGRAAGEKAAFALDERAGNLWQYGRGALADCLAVQPGAQPDSGVVSCAAPAPPTSSVDAPSRAELVREAADVFAVVGVTPGTGLKANDDGAGATYLDVPLTVEGLPIVDVNLSVGVDAEGIVSGLGLLDPTYSTVGKYPLVSARTGFDQLEAQPVPAIAPACPAGTTCPPPTPAKVTAARLAWLTSQDAGRTVLVPAWQFEVDGFYGPAVVAVSPEFLAGSGTDVGTPEPATDPGSGSGQASSVPGSPGTVEPAPAP